MKTCQKWRAGRLAGLFVLSLFLSLSWAKTAQAGLKYIPASSEQGAWNSILSVTGGQLVTDYRLLSSPSLSSQCHLTSHLDDGGNTRYSLWADVEVDAVTLSNVAELKFRNAGTVFGRPVDVWIKVSSLRVGRASGSCGCSAPRKRRLAFMELNSPIHIGVTATGANKIQDNFFCQHRKYYVDLTFSVYYAGTTTPVPAETPFYQTFYDIDAVSDYGTETFYGKSGFTGDLWVFDRQMMDLNAAAGNIKLQAIGADERGDTGMNNHWTWADADRAADGRTHTCNYGNGDHDSTINGGGVATIRGNTFTESYQCHICSSALRIYSPTASLSAPMKSVDSSHGYYDGDSCDWVVSQGLGTYLVNTWQPYTSCVFRDTMDPALTVTGVDVYKDSVSAGNRVAPGNYSYSLSGQSVTVAMSAAYLSNTSIYNGGKLIFVVHTKVKANGLGKSTIPNTGNVSLAGTSNNTNTVSIRPLYRVYVTHEGQGATDPPEKKEGIEWGGSSKVTYAPAKDWYTRDVYRGAQTAYTASGKNGLGHVSGPSLKEGSMLTEYTFTGIREDMHLHVVFIPIPELSVTKAIEGPVKSLPAFGSPLFYYKVSGTDYLGDAHTWYWAIPGEGTVTRKVPAGDYTVRELPIDRWQLMKVENVKNFSGLSVEGRGGSCSLKNGLPTDAPGSSAGDGHVRFTNRLSDWEDSGHNSQAENRLK